uniref:Uncharacterized protein n=1 Tax=Arion vulgaris TaxID=1028688 RepID=A0A0B7BI16_9EUPU
MVIRHVHTFIVQTFRCRAVSVTKSLLSESHGFNARHCGSVRFPPDTPRIVAGAAEFVRAISVKRDQAIWGKIWCKESRKSILWL